MKIKMIYPYRNRLIRALCFSSALFSVSSVSGQTVLLEDTFNADLGGTNPNTDVNLDAAARQSGGSLTTTYTENGSSDASLNTPAGGAFGGETVLLLRTESTGGASVSSAGVTTDTNFASSLVGQVYKIEFTGLVQTGGTPSADHWGSFFLTDSSVPTTPIAGTVDYGIMYRERDTNNLTIWKDGGNAGTSTVVDSGTSYFNSGTLFTLSITVDEVNGTVNTIVNEGLSNELALAEQSIDFDNGTDRYFGFYAQQGSATGLVDFRYDDFTLTAIPEPGSYALLAGMLGLGYVMARRRK